VWKWDSGGGSGHQVVFLIASPSKKGNLVLKSGRRNQKEKNCEGTRLQLGKKIAAVMSNTTYERQKGREYRV